MRWTYAIFTYGLLIIVFALTLYFLKLGRVEQQLSEATHLALVEKLEDSPKFETGQLKVKFSARKGTVFGVASTAAGMQIGREVVENLSATGLPEQAKTEYDFAELTHDWKLQPSFQAFAQGEEIALRAQLAQSTLIILKNAISKATGAGPGSPIDIETNQHEADAVALDNIAIPDWENTFGPAVEYFFSNKRLRESEIVVTASQELRLIGVIETANEAQALEEIMRDGFPSLVNNIVNMVRVERERHPLVLKEENGIITLEGVAPSPNSRDEIAEFLRSQLAPGQKLEAAIQILPEAPVPDWLSTKPTFFETYLASIKSPLIIIGSGEAMLWGIAPSMAAADELANLAQAQLSGYTVTSRLTFPEEASP
ncbi:MAG: hypothetical protein P1U82_19195 [Verrucomicrobiales bacterium]|jgi:hypothetical protein|nr:hypothetical protein [Verrucomicrobiales bacterium]